MPTYGICTIQNLSLRTTDHLISARRPDQVIVNKNNKKRVSAFPADHRVKFKEREKRDEYLDLARELKKTMENESEGDTNCNWRARYNHQSIGIGDLDIRGRVETIQTTTLLKSARILRRVLEI